MQSLPYRVALRELDLGPSSVSLSPECAVSLDGFGVAGSIVEPGALRVGAGCLVIGVVGKLLALPVALSLPLAVGSAEVTCAGKKPGIRVP